MPLVVANKDLVNFTKQWLLTKNITRCPTCAIEDTLEVSSQALNFSRRMRVDFLIVTCQNCGASLFFDAVKISAGHAAADLSANLFS